MQNRFVSHLYAMLKDSDARIRNEAAAAINQFNRSQSMRKSNISHKYSGNYLTLEFVADTLSNEVPLLFENPPGILNGFQPGLCDEEIHYRQVKKVLAKHLFDLTNILFDLKSNEQLVRIFFSKIIINKENSYKCTVY